MTRVQTLLPGGEADSFAKPSRWLVTFTEEGESDRQTIPVEASDAHAAQARVQVNFGGSTIHSVVPDDEAARSAAEKLRTRPARPDPKPKRKATTKSTASKQVAEKAKPALKGKTSGQVAKADNKAATGGRVAAAQESAKSGPSAKAAAPAPDAERAKAKADLQAQVVKLWKASKEPDPAKRRKMIAAKLGIPGRVMGILRDAGIDGKTIS